MTTAQILWITAFVMLGLLVLIGCVVALATQRRSSTHIEAMLVVAVGGVGLAIALPVWQDYRMRTKVAERLELARAPKALVEESLRKRGAPPAQLAVTAPLEYDPATGTLKIALPPDAYDGQPLLLVPRVASGAVTWTCTRPKEPAGHIKYLPAECRRQAGG